MLKAANCFEMEYVWMMLTKVYGFADDAFDSLVFREDSKAGGWSLGMALDKAHAISQDRRAFRGVILLAVVSVVIGVVFTAYDVFVTCAKSGRAVVPSRQIYV